jgi:hypothetical protein
MPILDCVDENHSEVECGDSDDEIRDNQKSDYKSDIPNREQSEMKLAPAVRGCMM